jgi:hypothetical protein
MRPSEDRATAFTILPADVTDDRLLIGQHMAFRPVASAEVRLPFSDEENSAVAPFLVLFCSHALAAVT